MELVPVPKHPYGLLTDIEIGALSAMFRSARLKARKAHLKFWWSLPGSRDYTDLIRELSELDPLFGIRKF